MTPALPSRRAWAACRAARSVAGPAKTRPPERKLPTNSEKWQPQRQAGLYVNIFRGALIPGVVMTAAAAAQGGRKGGGSARGDPPLRGRS
jgi:hypothetical protein